MYFCIEFFMVLDFKVNVRLVVGMTINFFIISLTKVNSLIINSAIITLG